MAANKISMDIEIDKVAPLLDSFKRIREIMSLSYFPQKDELEREHIKLAELFSEKVKIEKV